MAEGCHDRDTPLPKGLVNTGVGEGGDGISGERGQEDERHDSVTEVIVGFQLLVGQTWRHSLGLKDEGILRTYGIKAYTIFC